jgi:hypothetical protein
MREPREQNVAAATTRPPCRFNRGWATGGGAHGHEAMIDAYENYRRVPGRSQNDPGKFKSGKKGSKKIQISTKTAPIVENRREL